MPPHKQKSVVSTKDIEQKFSNPGDLERDLFARMRHTGNVCLILDNQMRLVRGKRDGGCMEKSMEGLVEIFSFLLQNNDSDSKGIET